MIAPKLNEQSMAAFARLAEYTKKSLELQNAMTPLWEAVTVAYTDGDPAGVMAGLEKANENADEVDRVRSAILHELNGIRFCQPELHKFMQSWTEDERQRKVIANMDLKACRDQMEAHEKEGCQKPDCRVPELCNARIAELTKGPPS